MAPSWTTPETGRGWFFIGSIDDVSGFFIRRFRQGGESLLDAARLLGTFTEISASLGRRRRVPGRPARGGNYQRRSGRSKKTFVGAVIVGLAVMLTAGTLVASNMGFKVNYTLQATAAGVSKDGTNVIALPDNRQTGMNLASQLQTDIGGTGVATNVQKFIKASNIYQIYTGVKGSAADFSLAPGEGYKVKVASNVNYIVVGSDDPSIAYPLQATAAGVSKDGTNFYAYNYHQTSTSASALQTEIGGSAVATNVQKFIKATNLLQVYTGIKGSAADFPLVPGEAYFIKVASNVNFTPSHY